MAFVSYSNFKGGLDTRRSELTSQPGVLLDAQDVIINEGAEIEKRLAFVNVSPAAASTFGSETWSSGIQVFGSIADPGGWNAPVSYLQLQHPAVFDGATYNAAYHAMTGVTCSTSFGGFAWVAATFADGNTFVFWGSKYVPAFRNGIVLQDNTGTATARNQFIATQLQAQLGTFAPLIYSVGPVTQNGTAYYFDFWSIPSNTYEALASVNSSVAGTINAPLISQQLDSVAAQAATSTFYILSSNALLGTVQSVKVNFGSGYVDVLGVPVPASSNIEITAFNVAAQINSYVSGNVVSASTNDNGVTVALNPNAGISQNGFNLQVNISGDIAVDNTGFVFSGAWANGDTITEVQFDATSAGLVTIFSGSIVWGANDTFVTFASRIATMIRAYCSGAHIPYTASANGASVYISRTVCDSNVPVGTSGSVVTYTTASGTLTPITGILTAPALNLSLSPTAPSIPSFSNGGTSVVVSVITTNGVSPLNFSWTLTGASNLVIASGAGTANINIIALNSNPSSGTLTCLVTDATGAQGIIAATVIRN